jgi:hypothetical protein
MPIMRLEKGELSPGFQPSTAPKGRRYQFHMRLTLVVAISTLTLVVVTNRMLPPAGGSIGYDYSYFLPYLLAGATWVRQNGWLAIPHFTPDFCGGIPWLANPQSMFYSLPQALAVALSDPVEAVKWSLYLYASVGATGTYILTRKCFGLSRQAAALAFCLFQLNGFLLFRPGIGHLTYLVFGLVPILCVCALLTSSVATRSRRVVDLGAATLGGGLLAVMAYGGALSYVVPAVLGAAIVIFLHQAAIGSGARPWLVLSGACLWSLPLSAMKLLPAYVFVSRYPRIYLPQYLFNDPFHLLGRMFGGLFMPEALDYFTGLNAARVGLHEFEFGVSIVPLALIALCLAVVRPLRIFQRPMAMIGICVVASVPLLGTFGSEAWGTALAKIPIINNNTMLMRWWSIYILPVILLSAISFDSIFRRDRWRTLGLAVGVLIASGQLLLRDLTYYTTGIAFPLYDSRPVGAAFQQMAAGMAPVGSISRLGPPEGQAAVRTTNSNDAFLKEASALPCYEPVFGYHLELFPSRGLTPGPIVGTGDKLNMADPRCFLDAVGVHCKPGDQFIRADAADMSTFAAHRPLPWQKPVWQRAASTISVIAFVLTTALLFLIVFAGRRAWTLEWQK